MKKIMGMKFILWNAFKPAQQVIVDVEKSTCYGEPSLRISDDNKACEVGCPKNLHFLKEFKFEDVYYSAQFRMALIADIEKINTQGETA